MVLPQISPVVGRSFRVCLGGLKRRQRKTGKLALPGHGVLASVERGAGQLPRTRKNLAGTLVTEMQFAPRMT